MFLQGNTLRPSPAFPTEEFNNHGTGLNNINVSIRRTRYRQSGISDRQRSSNALDRNGCAFSSVNEGKVVPAILSIKSNAVGLDEIPLKFIKITVPVTHIINHNSTNSSCLKIWKKAKAFPVYKKLKVTIWMTSEQSIFFHPSQRF